MSEIKKAPLVVIVGPTAVGKTNVSIKLAKRFNGEIVSADSRLLYREMDIGTAKPSELEKAGVPHHLINVAYPDEPWNLAVYQREAYKAINDILNRGWLPFLVGGTGQYIRAIIEGWNIPSQRPDYELREVLDKWAGDVGPEGLYQRLKRIDPDAAEKIDSRNLRRTVRALEVIFKTGHRFSDLRRKQECPYSPIILGINRPRDELYNRIDQRIDKMLKDGLVDEIQNLLNAGYSPELSTMSAIGYGEIIQYLLGEITYNEAVKLIQRNTRIFVRRQANWFKIDDPHIHWFDASLDLVEKMEKTIRSELYVEI